VRTWDPTTGQQRAELTGHTGPVNAVAITPDGTWLATAADDRTVRTWNATGVCLAQMRTEEPLVACAWDPRGPGLIAVGTAGLYRFEFRPPRS
jgi:WD40 repeat protein